MIFEALTELANYTKLDIDKDAATGTYTKILSLWTKSLMAPIIATLITDPLIIGLLDSQSIVLME